MKPGHLAPLLLPLLTLGCPSGWRLQRTEGDALALKPDLFTDAACAGVQIPVEAEGDAACARAMRPVVHCAEGHPALCRQDPEKNPVSDATCSNLRSLFAFVHISDAQLKEHRIHIEGALSEAAYDGLTNGAARTPALERHDDAVLLATMLSANALLDPAPLAAAFAPCPPPAPPGLAIHTGDAVDAGMFSELMQFLAATEQLRMPFFNVVGNHDNLFFGTFPPEHMKGLNVAAPYVPIVDTDRFLRFHAKEERSRDLSLPHVVRDHHLPSELGCVLEPSGACGARTAPPSLAHGFDLPCDAASRASGLLCAEARGYYAFDVPLSEGSLRFVVLNTAEVVPTSVGQGFHRRSRANLLPEQIRWLRAQLRPAPGVRHALVFGHHDLGSFLDEGQGGEVRDLLLQSPHVLAYVTGHRHVDAFLTHLRPDGSSFWEIVAGSTLVHPQLARHVEVLESGVGPGRSPDVYLRVTSFRQRFGDEAAAIEPTASSPCPARLGTFALPRTPPDHPGASSECHRLAQRAAMGRRGARDDVNDVDRREERDAIPSANALIRVRRGTP